MNRLSEARQCDFGALIDYRDWECSGDATVFAVVEFADGQRATFNLCESCAAHQEKVGQDDPRTPRIITARRA